MRKDKERKPLPLSGSRSDIVKFNSERAKDGGKKRLGFDFGYLFSALLTIAVAFLSVGLVIYFGYHMVNVFKADVTYSPAYPVTQTEYRRGVGYIFREEAIIVKTSDGTPYYRSDDGERLGVNELICDLYSAANDVAYERIAEIDRRLSVLGESLGTGVVREGLPEALRDSGARYDEVMALLSRENYSDAASLSDAFLSSLVRLRLLEGGADAVSLEISRLKSEKDGLITSYGRINGSVYADRVGYFFRNADGYESVFDPSLLGEITVGGFADLITQEPEDVSQAVGKMVTEPKWYLTVPLDGESASGFAEGGRYNIVFHDNESRTLTMSLERLVLDLDDHDSDGDRAEALLIFSSTKMPEDFRYLRSQDVSIEAASYRGYRIPITAVRYYDGMTGVYVLAGGYVLFRQIDVIYEEDGYCIAALYSDAEPGKPLTYTSLGFAGRSAIDGMELLDGVAESHGWEKTEHDNGGIPVAMGRTLRYFYHLDDLEQVILTGKDLFHGKALD